MDEVVCVKVTRISVGRGGGGSRSGRTGEWYCIPWWTCEVFFKVYLTRLVCCIGNQCFTVYTAESVGVYQCVTSVRDSSLSVSVTMCEVSRDDKSVCICVGVKVLKPPK